MAHAVWWSSKFLEAVSKPAFRCFQYRMKLPAANAGLSNSVSSYFLRSDLDITPESFWPFCHKYLAKWNVNPPLADESRNCLSSRSNSGNALSNFSETRLALIKMGRTANAGCWNRYCQQIESEHFLPRLLTDGVLKIITNNFECRRNTENYLRVEFYSKSTSYV